MGNTSGAQNNEAFRQIVTTKSNEMPNSIQFNTQGMFNEYYFDTGLLQTQEIFEPNYNFARIENPITKKEELFVGIGINCRDDGKNLRNTLNLMILLDISDAIKFEYQQKNEIKKIDLAKDVLISLINNLREEDNFGITLFNNKSKILQELESKSKINEKELQKTIQEIQAFYGTNMESALLETQQSFKRFSLLKNKEFTNNDTRIIFITDAQPNCGNSKDGLISLTEQFSSEYIFITYIGIGLDFNVQLTEQLTKIRGCNFFSVHSGSQCKSILIEDFNYIMTPQVFNTEIEFESQHYEIEQSYGTNFRDQDKKQYFKIETIMAGNKQNNEIKGGMILAKLKKNQKIIEINDANQDKFIITYEIAKTKENIRKSDNFHLSQQFSDYAINSYTNLGIRKAVLLAIHSDFLQTNLKDLKKLNIEQLSNLIKYFEEESKAMNTQDLYQEIELLQRLKTQVEEQ